MPKNKTRSPDLEAIFTMAAKCVYFHVWNWGQENQENVVMETFCVPLTMNIEQVKKEIGNKFGLQERLWLAVKTKEGFTKITSLKQIDNEDGLAR